MRTLRFALVSLLALTACEPPPVVATKDRRQNTDLARIEGSIVVQSTSRGNLVVLLYDVERPPPPQGSGKPVAFELLSAEEVFGPALVPPAGQAPSSGPFTATFTFDSVPKGRYMVRGFIDTDGCLLGASPCRPSDWLPWYSVTAEPNTGDVGGAAVDPLTLQPRIYEVAGEVGADGHEHLLPVTGATVTYADSARIPLERPSFRVELMPGDTAVMDLTKPKVMTLKPEVIREGVVSTAPPAFFVRFDGFDANGQPLDADKNGVPDVWPKVLVRKLVDTPHSLTEENDLNRDSKLDDEGIEYAPAVGTEDGVPDKVILAAGFHPDALRALYGPDGQPLKTPDGKPMTVPFPSLPLVVMPTAYNIADMSQPMPLKSVPGGRYSILLLSFTGQTWKVPNELDPVIAQSVGLPQVDSQDFNLQVPLRSR